MTVNHTSLAYLRRYVPERKTIAGIRPASYVYWLHTESCAQRIAKFALEEIEWTKEWPKYCRKCGGSGVTHWTENQSPIGSGEYWPQSNYGPCFCIESEDGLAEMKCPRCGEEIYDLVTAGANGDDDEARLLDDWFFKMGKCPRCGWNHGKSPDDAIGNWPECACYELEFGRDIVQRAARKEDLTPGIPIIFMPREEG